MNVTNFSIVLNKGEYGGGIHNHGELVVVNCAIESNSATIESGGIANDNGRAVVNGSSIEVIM